MLRITLNNTQPAELQQVARQAVGRISERAHFVLMAAAGVSPVEIGRRMGYRPATVRAWLKAYQQDGLAGLQDRGRSGRPRKEQFLTAIVQAQASQPPPNFGYLQACWTVALLVLHLVQHFRVEASPARVRRALHRAGFGWTRPKLAPARRPDPQADAKRERLTAVLADPAVTVIAADESDSQLLAVVRAMWQRIGEQVRIVTPGGSGKRAVFGALNLRTGEWWYQVTARKRGVEMIAFLERLLTAYPTGHVAVILDNAPIHVSRLVRTWVAAHPRLELVYLPTYSGHQLNPVEKVWWALKGEIAANRCFRSLVDLEMAIHRFFADFSPERALGLANSETVRQALAAIA
jgi:transposase